MLPQMDKLNSGLIVLLAIRLIESYPEAQK